MSEPFKILTKKDSIKIILERHTNLTEEILNKMYEENTKEFEAWLNYSLFLGRRENAETVLRTISVERFKSDSDERLRPIANDNEQDDPSNW